MPQLVLSASTIQGGRISSAVGKELMLVEESTSEPRAATNAEVEDYLWGHLKKLVTVWETRTAREALSSPTPL